MNPLSIRVAIDVGSTRHRVAVGLPDGNLLDIVRGVRPLLYSFFATINTINVMQRQL